MPTLYDAIGRTYSATRIPDPRIAHAIDEALGDASTVVNVGAGAGAYEPSDRLVIAVEPSRTMLDQRSARGRAVQAVAEALPFPPRSFDAAMGVLTSITGATSAGALRRRHVSRATGSCSSRSMRASRASG